MKRLTTFIPAAVAASVLVTDVCAQDIRVLESRVFSIEQRLAAIETRITGVIQPQNVKLPAPASYGTPHIPAPKSAPAVQDYVIREGDSLGGIARKFNIPRQALLKANKLSEGQPIYIGEALKIPSQPTGQVQVPKLGNGLLHVVKPGETLTGISRHYNASVPSIKQANQLHNDLIGVGQRLVIPASNQQRSQSFTHQPTANKNVVLTSANITPPKANVGPFEYDNPLLNNHETYGFYAVQNGDNLYALARDFFTSMNELQRLNKLGKATTLRPGSELVVPTSKYNAYHQKIAHN